MTKLNQTIDGYVLKVPGGEYVGLDHASGGYPYIPHGITGIHVWSTKEDAESYKNIIAGGSAMGDMGHASSWRVKHIVIMEVDAD